MISPDGEFIPYEIVMMELDIPVDIIAMQPQEVYDRILQTNTEEENYEFCAELVKSRKRLIEK